MTKYAVLVCCFLLLHCCRLFAQQYGIGGRVQNSRHEYLPQANISLQNISLGKLYPVQTISDSGGYYRFEKVPAGKYILTASYTGYVKVVSDTITVNASATNYTHHFILLEDSATLKGITVKSKKRQRVEMDKGKVIFNVQDAATTSGLTAFDVLKKMPGVTVDQNENISLRGSAGINVLIDGKMTYLSGTQLTNYLKGISAEDISKIELNLAPSAEYDAAGNAGIINIVPKRNVQKGYAVDIRSGITKGHYWMASENISVSHRSEKPSLYGAFDFKMPRNFWKGSSGNTLQDGTALITLQRQSESAYKPLYYSWRMGAEWQLLPKHRISMDYNGYWDDWKAVYNSTVKSVGAVGSLISSIRSSNRLIEPYYYDAFNVNYRFDIDSAGKKITAETHYVSYRNYSDAVMTTDIYDGSGDFTGRNVLRSHQPGFIKIKSAKADAVLPFKKISVKTGLKYAEVENDNRYRFDSLYNGNYLEVENMSNHFKYKERIAAAYISASKKLNKTSMDAGLRLEYTKADGYTIRQEVNNQWEYTRLFPNFSLEQEIAVGDKLSFSVSRRINRPSYSQLNPVRWYTDQYFYYAGNPNLLPEMAWLSSVGYTLKQKYVFTFSYARNSHYINRKLIIDSNGVSIKSLAANLGNMHRLDMMVSVPLQVFSFWELQLMPDLSYMSYPVSQLSGEKILSKWFATISLEQQFKFPAGIKVDISMQYYSAGLRGIYITRPNFYTDLGLKKSILKNRLDLQLTCSDIFNTTRYRGVSQSSITDYHYNDKPDTRRIGITLHYHMGNDLIKSSSKKTDEQERL
ncbi:MAG: TonB-dependent receptor [Agriterribacter sp.]